MSLWYPSISSCRLSLHFHWQYKKLTTFNHLGVCIYQLALNSVFSCPSQWLFEFARRAPSVCSSLSTQVVNFLTRTLYRNYLELHHLPLDIPLCAFDMWTRTHLFLKSRWLSGAQRRLDELICQLCAHSNLSQHDLFRRYWTRICANTLWGSATTQGLYWLSLSRSTLDFEKHNLKMTLNASYITSPTTSNWDCCSALQRSRVSWRWRNTQMHQQKYVSCTRTSWRNSSFLNFISFVHLRLFSFFGKKHSTYHLRVIVLKISFLSFWNTIIKFKFL